MYLFSLLVTISLLSSSAFASAPQLSCARTDKGTQQQLAITPNALGSHDVSLRSQAGGRQTQRTWLALQLACEVQGKGDNKTWHCTAAQHESHSPHANSKLRSRLVQDDSSQLEISITSPLLPEGEASYRFASKHCTSQPPVATSTSPYSCMAHFSGARYDPNQGDCVEEDVSGCSNPFPYSSRNDCRSALKL